MADGSTVGGVQFNGEGAIRGYRFSIAGDTFALYNGSDSYTTFSVDSDNGAFMAASGRFKVDDWGKLTSTGLTAEGADGGLYVQDVQGAAGKETMIFAGPKGGSSTLRIDPTNGNFMTKGTMSVADENWNAVTQIQGSGENIGDIAVGIQYDGAGNITGQNIVLDASTGDVISKGDVTTLNDDGTVNYSLNTIGANTAGIVRLGETTTIENTVSVDKWGLKVLDETGKTVADINSTTGGINAANGKFHVYREGQIEGTALSLMNNGAQNVLIDNSGTARFGDKDGANVRVEDGVLTVNRSSGQVAALSENGLTLTSSNDIRATLNAEQIANLNNVVQEDGNVVGTTVKTTSGADLDVVDGRTQNMWADEHQTKFSHSVNVEGSFSSGNGAVSLKGNWGQEASIELRDAENNVYALTATKLGTINDVIDDNGNVTANRVTVGNTVVTGSSVTTNYLLADEGEIGSVMISGGLVDGVDVSSLGQAFDSETGVIGGITRTDENNDGILDTTTIEGSTSFDANGMNVGNGAVVANTDGSFSAANGAFDVDTNGNVTANRVTVGNTLVTGTSVTTDVIYADEGQIGGTLIQGGFVNADNVFSANYNLEEVGADLKELSGDFTTTNANVAGIKRTGSEEEGYTTTIEDTLSVSKDSVSANVGNSFFNVEEDGIYMSNNGNGLAVGEDGVTANSGNASFNLSNNNYNVTVGNSTVAVNGNGTTFTNGEDNGETVINGGTITASGDFVTVDEEGNTKYTLNTVGSDLDNLTGEFETTNANVAGIERFGEGAPGEGITTIEDGALFVSKNVTYMSSGDAMIQTSTDSAYMSFGDNMISINKGGINLTGSVGFTGHDGGRYTLSELEGRVSDLEEKTQNIKLPNEPGQGGETGDPNVPATGEGHTGVEGDVTVGGDLTVNGGIEAGNSNIGGVGLKDGDVTAVDGNFSGKVTVGDENGTTSITGEGITVGDKNGVSIKNDEVRVGGGEDGKGGSYMNDTDVVTGEGNSLNDTANRVGNLEQGVSELNNRVGELEDRIDKVGAMAAAIANLRTMGYDPAAPTEVAVGIGQYRDETGAALGLFHYPNRDFMLSLSVSTSGDEVMGGIGATWKFGRKSPEKVAEIKKAQAEADARRAEEAKLAKAEEMKQAAKEAKIKAQQERHAKLAAERAAQAEAAK